MRTRNLGFFPARLISENEKQKSFVYCKFGLICSANVRQQDTVCAERDLRTPGGPLGEQGGDGELLNVEAKSTRFDPTQLSHLRL